MSSFRLLRQVTLSFYSLHPTHNLRANMEMLSCYIYKRLSKIWGFFFGYELHFNKKLSCGKFPFLLSLLHCVTKLLSTVGNYKPPRFASEYKRFMFEFVLGMEAFFSFFPLIISFSFIMLYVFMSWQSFYVIFHGFLWLPTFNLVLDIYVRL